VPIGSAYFLLGKLTLKGAVDTMGSRQQSGGTAFASARVVGVLLFAVRTLLVVRGLLFFAALIGFFEVMVYIWL